LTVNQLVVGSIPTAGAKQTSYNNRLNNPSHGAVLLFGVRHSAILATARESLG